MPDLKLEVKEKRIPLKRIEELEDVEKEIEVLRFNSGVD